MHLPLSRRNFLAAAPAVALGATARPGKHQHQLPVRGADISFTLQEETAGARYSVDGTVRPIERILADAGATHVRLRIWVNPPTGYSDLASALILARRARRAHLKVLIDLHYSDFWADPGKQPTPAAWQQLDLAGLAEKVRHYTRGIVESLARQGTPADMVQTGNEITSGMLWPLGQIYQSDGEHWTEFGTLLRAAVDGVRTAAGPMPRTMIHIDRGGDNAGSRYFFDHVLAQGIEFDVIGESYYPFWHGPISALQANLSDLAGRYGKDLVVAETAYPWTLTDGDSTANSVNSADQLPDDFPPTPAGQLAYFAALRRVLSQVPGGRGTGFFDWEPEWIPGVGWEPGAGNPNDNLTMFDQTGRALPALRAFRRSG